MIPDLNDELPEKNPTWEVLAELGAELGVAVLIGHSESGIYPFHAALINPRAVKGLINIEAGGTYHENFGQTEEGNPSQQDIKILVQIPILMIYGDYLDGTSWQSVLEDCQALVNEINTAGSNATMIHLRILESMATAI